MVFTIFRKILGAIIYMMLLAGYIWSTYIFIAYCKPGSYGFTRNG